MSAVCASGDSAGWQQVKIMRSWSSRTGPTSFGSSGWCSSSACAWRASRVDSRRRRSMARLRAVVTIHAPGLGGSVSPHFWTATANASWTASSASPMSPRRRVSVATHRPYSAR